MPALLSRASALAFLKAQVSASPVALSLPSGNQTYKVGDTVDVEMTGVRLPYLTLFNLPPNGRVECPYCSRLFVNPKIAGRVLPEIGVATPSAHEAGEERPAESPPPRQSGTP